ncbi:hypothetical protein [Oryza sativa Japonica Group]|jgi:hypothetical protein|uniref:Os01g0914900 protein n=1 Tax=Oryza sativa subsp. japonica TaxID=39947 RepID=A3A0V6_ORYSJ|nr:hypothetical protein OsJ_04528 [Oryza sativa Japonica Group]KAF2953958.1 hypothetical protein DAI22_01g446000 [Oryza sativa Japonica Group]BAD82394.1 hypothetical protein [Oryza sativa Japonica Group]BAS75869.1 Os01g0914900 [Oryza sativa Japonica Group]
MAHGQSLAQLPPCLAVPLARVREAIVGGGVTQCDIGRSAGAVLGLRGDGRGGGHLCPASTGNLLYVFSRLAHPAATVAFTMKPQYLLRRESSYYA